ncbi:MarR family winged helix-turn-helix transcriptional regulator, partial [Streptomyces sp. NPDC004011]
FFWCCGPVRPPPPGGRSAGGRPAGFVERAVSPADRREVRLHLSNRGRAFLDDLRARREKELQAVLERMPAAKRTALLEGLEAFCDAAASQIHHDAPRAGDRTA